MLLTYLDHLQVSLEKALADKEAPPPYDYTMAVIYAFQLTTALAHLHHVGEAAPVADIWQ
jgi:hypothetical protein